MFRPTRVFERSTVVVRCGEEVIARKRAPIFTPGEMVVVRLDGAKTAALGSDVTVSMEEN